MNADEPPRPPDKFGDVMRGDKRGAHRRIDDALDELAASIADEIEGKRLAVFHHGDSRDAAIISWQRNGYVWHSCWYDGVRWQTVQGHYEYTEESAAREAALSYLAR